jgi:hypothetical protein
MSVIVGSAGAFAEGWRTIPEEDAGQEAGWECVKLLLAENSSIAHRSTHLLCSPCVRLQQSTLTTPCRWTECGSSESVTMARTALYPGGAEVCLAAVKVVVS